MVDAWYKLVGDFGGTQVVCRLRLKRCRAIHTTCVRASRDVCHGQAGLNVCARRRRSALESPASFSVVVAVRR